MASLPRTRLHALWTLDGLDALPAALVVRALDDASADVRRSAVRLAERWLALGDATMTTAVSRPRGRREPRGAAAGRGIARRGSSRPA